MEIAPAMAVLVGIGADNMMRLLGGKIRIVIQMILCISFIVLLSILIRLHPNENAYFNVFVGGIRGAQSKNLIDPFLTNGNVYKQGATWLNTNGEKDAKVAILDGRTFALSPLYLRPDISISPDHFSDFQRRGEYILVTDINTAHAAAEFSYWYVKTYLIPVHVVAIDGVPLLTIYKNDSSYVRVKTEVDQSMPFTKAMYATPDGEYLALDLKKEVLVNKLVLSNPPSSCSYNQPYSAYDEVIQFIPSPLPTGFDISDHSYALTEKRYVGGSVEYLFAGETASTVKIFVRSKESCFNGGTVTAVYGLPK
jgi:hypothetical protein